MVRYVGQSKFGVSRLVTHLIPSALKTSSLKTNWIKNLISNWLLPDIVVLERCTLEQLDEREIFWISHYRKQIGKKLTNMTEGGTGGNTGKSYKRYKPVIAINLKTKQTKEYAYVKQTRFDGFHPTDVVRCCKGTAKSHKGHYFHYKGQPPVIQISRCNRPILVIDLVDGTETRYERFKDAAKALGICLRTIYNSFESGQPVKKRFRFRRLPT